MVKARLKGTRNPRETPCASRRKDVVLAAGQIQILTACLSLQLCQPMCKCRQHFTKTPIVPFQVHQVSHLETRSHNVMLTPTDHYRYTSSRNASSLGVSQQETRDQRLLLANLDQQCAIDGRQTAYSLPQIAEDESRKFFIEWPIK